MKKTLKIFFILYYSLGILFLPMGDFAVLKNLQEMYEHCKANEDKDMNPLDFITDHLMNIDGFFDRHNNGDEQKPHSPIHVNHQTHLVAFQPFISFKFGNKIFHCPESTLFSSYLNSFVKSDYISKIFRPPIIA